MDVLDYWHTIGKSCSLGEAFSDLLAERGQVQLDKEFIRGVIDSTATAYGRRDARAALDPDSGEAK